MNEEHSKKHCINRLVQFRLVQLLNACEFLNCLVCVVVCCQCCGCDLFFYCRKMHENGKAGKYIFWWPSILFICALRLWRALWLWMTIGVVVKWPIAYGIVFDCFCRIYRVGLCPCAPSWICLIKIIVCCFSEQGTDLSNFVKLCQTVKETLNVVIAQCFHSILLLKWLRVFIGGCLFVVGFFVWNNQKIKQSSNIELATNALVQFTKKFFI